ncbi:hypothetical protein NDU88_006664 [Pleurodeles waltl]|uniref:Uncharacterized protein n=1 Tax=Pleurodeles waltl TaxID=8319 RepID=A0AAV7MI20_PLEWA|nr:hypothetical protein NDU88_006664 [Pleurodeles waltl]
MYYYNGRQIQLRRGVAPIYRFQMHCQKWWKYHNMPFMKVFIWVSTQSRNLNGIHICERFTYLLQHKRVVKGVAHGNALSRQALRRTEGSGPLLSRLTDPAQGSKHKRQLSATLQVACAYYTRPTAHARQFPARAHEAQAC